MTDGTIRHSTWHRAAPRGTRPFVAALAVCSVLAACSGSSSKPPEADGGQPDAGQPDAGQPDAGRSDGGQPDAGPGDDTAILLQGGAGAEVVPHVAARADGSTWLSWYTALQDGGDYSIRLQRIDTDGHGQLGPDGVLASVVDSASFVMDYALIADAEDRAVIAYTPTTDSVLHVQRFDADGTPTWGDRGVAVTPEGEKAYAPHAALAGDGTVFVAWTSEQGEQAGLAVQRLDASGASMWASPVRIPDPPSQQVTLGGIVPSGQTDVLVVWIESPFNTPGDAFVQRYDTDGQAVWPEKLKLNADDPVPFLNTPVLVSDGAGGLYAAWTVTNGTLFAAFAQHLDAQGAEGWGRGGRAVSGAVTSSHLSSAIDAVGDQVVVTWQETDELQTTSGLFVQAFDAAGSPMLGDSGVAVVPATDEEGALAADVRVTPKGAAVFNAFGPVNGLDLRVGVALIPLMGQPTPVRELLSDVASVKADPDVSAKVADGYWLVWSDGRSGTDDIWGAWWRPAP